MDVIFPLTLFACIVHGLVCVDSTCSTVCSTCLAFFIT